MKELEDLFLRNKDAVTNFMKILQPKIEAANDEYEQLHWHHIYEEEEQRLDRLKDLLPRVSYYVNNSESQSIENLEFIHLLQDISLEKFGLHNFEEHLDLALFKANGDGHVEKLKNMRQMTEEDYEKIKQLLNSLNKQFNGAANRAGSIPTDEKEDVNDHVKLDKFTVNTEAILANPKRFTVGSLKHNEGGI